MPWHSSNFALWNSFSRRFSHPTPSAAPSSPRNVVILGLRGLALSGPLEGPALEALKKGMEVLGYPKDRAKELVNGIGAEAWLRKFVAMEGLWSMEKYGLCDWENADIIYIYIYVIIYSSVYICMYEKTAPHRHDEFVLRKMIPNMVLPHHVVSAVPQPDTRRRDSVLIRCLNECQSIVANARIHHDSWYISDFWFKCVN